MKVLLDTCVWGGTLKHVAIAGLDVVWTGNWSEDPGDEEILALAYKEGRVLATISFAWYLPPFTLSTRTFCRPCRDLTHFALPVRQ